MPPVLSIHENSTGVAVPSVTIAVTVNSHRWTKRYRAWPWAIHHAELLGLISESRRLRMEQALTPQDLETFALLDGGFQEDILFENGFDFEDISMRD